MKREKRFLMGKSECEVLCRYGKGARVRNVMVKMLEPYRGFTPLGEVHYEPGDVIVTPVRKLFRGRSK